jgi:hypothetical protein
MPTRTDEKRTLSLTRKEIAGKDDQNGHRYAGPHGDGAATDLRPPVPRRAGRLPRAISPIDYRLAVVALGVEGGCCANCGRPWAALEAADFLPACDGDWADRVPAEIVAGAAVVRAAEDAALSSALASEVKHEGDGIGRKPKAAASAKPRAGDVPARARAPEAALRGVASRWKVGDFKFHPEHAAGYELLTDGERVEEARSHGHAPAPRNATLTSWPPADRNDKCARRAIDAIEALLADRKVEPDDEQQLEHKMLRERDEWLGANDNRRGPWMR